MNQLNVIRLGTLPEGIFPPDDCNTYLYNRPSGYTFYYSKGTQTQIPTNALDALNLPIPILEDVIVTSKIQSSNTVPLPDRVHNYLFYFDGNLYSYDWEGTIRALVVGDIREGLNEW